MPTLNNITTQDNYTEQNELNCPGSNTQRLIVTGASIYYRIAERTYGYTGSAASYQEEIFLPPGYYTWAKPIEQFKCRSAVKGKPAQVTFTPS